MSTGHDSIIVRASQALSKAETEARIKELIEQSQSIVAVTDSASREACHESLMTLKNLRVAIQKRGKEGREEAVQYSKAVIGIEKDLISLIEPSESRLAKLRDDFDAAKEREREARVQAELKRQADLQERIAELRGPTFLTASSGSAKIFEFISDLERIPVDDSFEEYRQQADDAKTAALSRLKDLHAAALVHEAEQERIKAERAELAKLRAEQEARDRQAREEQAKRDAEAQAERDRLAAEEHARQVQEAHKHAEELRLKREEIEREAAENRRIAAQRQAELDRAAEQQRQANAAQAKRLAEQQADIERQQAALAEAHKPKPVLSKSVQKRLKAPMPSRAAIVSCVAERFEVSDDIAAIWLRSIDWEQTAA